MSIKRFECNATNANDAPCPFEIEVNDDFETDRQLSEALTAGNLPDSDLSTLFKRILRPGDTVIDIGANVGWFTMLAAALVGSTGKVMSFEPAPENAQRLRRNAELNNFDHVQIFEVALSDCADLSTAAFYLNPYGNGGHALWDMQAGREGREPSKVVEVITSTIDACCNVSPKLIKIDTEGHDQRVLVGANRILAAHPPYIFTEVHSVGLQNFGDSERSLRALMEGYGYSTFLIIPGEAFPLFIPPNTELKSKYALNLLFAAPNDIGALYPALEISALMPETHIKE